MAATEKHSERWKQIYTSIMTEPGVHFILQNKTKHAPGKFAHHWLPEDTQHIEHVCSTLFLAQYELEKNSPVVSL